MQNYLEEWFDLHTLGGIAGYSQFSWYSLISVLKSLERCSLHELEERGRRRTSDPLKRILVKCVSASSSEEIRSQVLEPDKDYICTFC